jgi:hypothetical protein
MKNSQISINLGNGEGGITNAQCPMPNAQCPMPNAQCPMWNFQTGRQPDKMLCIFTTAPITAIAGAVKLVLSTCSTIVFS